MKVIKELKNMARTSSRTDLCWHTVSCTTSKASKRSTSLPWYALGWHFSHETRTTKRRPRMKASRTSSQSTPTTLTCSRCAQFAAPSSTRSATAILMSCSTRTTLIRAVCPSWQVRHSWAWKREMMMATNNLTWIRMITRRDQAPGSFQQRYPISVSRWSPMLSLDESCSKRKTLFSRRTTTRMC